MKRGENRVKSSERNARDYSG